MERYCHWSYNHHSLRIAPYIQSLHSLHSLQLGPGPHQQLRPGPHQRLDGMGSKDLSDSKTQGVGVAWKVYR